MWKATIRGLLARRIRLVVTALAVLLGVSFVSATYVLTDTVKRSFDAVFEQTVSGVDLVVEGPRTLGDAGESERIPESTLDDVGPCRGWRGRRASSPGTRSSSAATARASEVADRRRSACRGWTTARSASSTTA